MKQIIYYKWLLFYIFTVASINTHAFLIVEDFESSTWAQDKGWYDMGTTTTSTEQAASGSHSLAYTFNTGDQQDTNFGGMRLTLPESDTIYLSYNRMYEDSWVWGPRHDLHDFYVFADASTYQTPTDTKLTSYFELSEGMADTIIRAKLQDNSPYNDVWAHETANDVVIDAGVWHNIQAMVQMNDPGESNGIIRMWVDGNLQVERTGLLLRAEDDEDIMFNQLFFGPWMISGSVKNQTFWTDDIMISDEPFSLVEAEPVPIPSAMLLLSSAFISLFGYSKQNR